MTKSDYYIPRIGLSKVNNHINGRPIFLSDEESNRGNESEYNEIKNKTAMKRDFVFVGYRYGFIQ